MKTVKYLFWKLLLCFLTNIPACAAGVLLLLIGGDGLLRKAAAGASDAFLPAASGIGLLVFFAVTGGLFLRLKLGDLPTYRFILLETGAYALFLALAVLCSYVPWLRLFFLPHCFFRELLGHFAIALNIPLYGLLSAVCCLVNRKKEATREEP